MIMAHERLVQLEEKTVKNDEQISDLKKNISNYKGYAEENNEKLDLIKENIKSQEEELARVQRRAEK